MGSDVECCVAWSGSAHQATSLNFLLGAGAIGGFQVRGASHII